MSIIIAYFICNQSAFSKLNEEDVFPVNDFLLSSTGLLSSLSGLTWNVPMVTLLGAWVFEMVVLEEFSREDNRCKLLQLLKINSSQIVCVNLKFIGVRNINPRL